MKNHEGGLENDHSINLCLFHFIFFCCSPFFFFAHTLTHIYMHTYIHIYAHVCTYIHTYIHITHTHTHIHSFKCRLHISRYLGTQIQIPVTPLLQVGPLRGAGGKAGLQLPARILPTAGLWVERPPSGDQCGFGFVLFFYCFPNSLYCVHLGRFVV